MIEIKGLDKQTRMLVEEFIGVHGSVPESMMVNIDQYLEAKMMLHLHRNIIKAKCGIASNDPKRVQWGRSFLGYIKLHINRIVEQHG